MKRLSLLASIALALIVMACNEDGNEAVMADFTVTIENVFEAKDYFGAGSTDGIGPGTSHSFSFNAGTGHYLSFATMLAQSNDLFYGFGEMGIALFDQNGNPISGDLTSQVYLWDAGTEVNEEPGVGPNQAPRQSGANTGTDENGTVELIGDVADGFTYPSVAEVISVTIENDGATGFTVTITNHSDQIDLTGPLAPGAWVVHSDAVQLFNKGQASSVALEKLSEDGDNADLVDMAMMNSGLVSPFAPGVYAIFDEMNPVFIDNSAASAALEALAEDGNPGGFNFDAIDDVATWGVFSMPAGASGDAPIFPGESYEFSFTASSGDMLSFATMLVQSNDLFVAPSAINLFTNDIPLSGDITDMLQLWDASTEANEFPGAGLNQAPRQAGPDTGADESGNVIEVNDGFTYPSISSMVRVTISSN